MTAVEYGLLLVLTAIARQGACQLLVVALRLLLQGLKHRALIGISGQA